MHGRFDNSNVIMMYLLGVAFAAARFGRWPSVLAAALSVSAFDFFFVAPHLTFAVSDTQYLVTFGVMLVVALLISTLAVRLRGQVERARRREHRTRLLYAPAGSWPRCGFRARSRKPACATSRTSSTDRPRSCCPTASAGCNRCRSPPSGFPADARERAVADWAFTHGRPAGLGTDTLPGRARSTSRCPAGDAPLGVLGVAPHRDLLPLSPDQLDLLETLAARSPHRCRPRVSRARRSRRAWRRSASGCAARS